MLADHVVEPGEPEPRRTERGIGVDRRAIGGFRVFVAALGTQQVRQIVAEGRATPRKLDARAQMCFSRREITGLLARDAEQVHRIGVARCDPQQVAARGFGGRELPAAQQVLDPGEFARVAHARNLASPREPRQAQSYVARGA